MRSSVVSCLQIAVLLCCCATSDAQVLAPAWGSALKPSGRTDRAVFRAGDTVTVAVSLGEPAPRKLIIVTTAYCDSRAQLTSQATADEGASEVTFQFAFARDAQSATCRVVELEVQPPPAKSGDQTVVLPTAVSLAEPVQFEVVGPPRVKEVIPGKPFASVELSEAQYLRSRAVPLKEQREQLLSFLDQHANANETRVVDDFLIGILKAAQTSLRGTRHELDVRYSPTGGTPPLFEDLDRRYSALIVDISDHEAHLALRTEGASKLMRVEVSQNETRRPESRDSVTVLAGTLPPDASESLNLLDWNIAIYEKIADTGTQSFSVALVSSPADALVEAKRIGEDYVPLGSRTTISKVSFPFAIWTFRFTKIGCRPYIQRYDPVRDTSPTVSVELNCGH